MTKAVHSLLGRRLGVDNLTDDLVGKDYVPVVRAPANRVVTVTTTNVTITRADHDLKDIVLNRAAGITATLPLALSTNLGTKFNFYVPVSLSGSSKIKVASAADTITGRIQVDASLASNAPTSFSAGSTADTISLNGTTTGGKKGDHLTLTVIASNLYHASGEIQATGVSATPFVVSVS